MRLGGDDTEEVILPTYGDETLLILVKGSNVMIEDGDLFKDKYIGEEEDRYTCSTLKKRYKLKAIKETFRNFRAYLKGDPRDK